MKTNLESAYRLSRLFYPALKLANTHDQQEEEQGLKRNKFSSIVNISSVCGVVHCSTGLQISVCMYVYVCMCGCGCLKRYVCVYMYMLK